MAMYYSRHVKNNQAMLYISLVPPSMVSRLRYARLKKRTDGNLLYDDGLPARVHVRSPPRVPSQSYIPRIAGSWPASAHALAATPSTLFAVFLNKVPYGHGELAKLSPIPHINQYEVHVSPTHSLVASCLHFGFYGQMGLQPCWVSNEHSSFPRAEDVSAPFRVCLFLGHLP